MKIGASFNKKRVTQPLTRIANRTAVEQPKLIKPSTLNWIILFAASGLWVPALLAEDIDKIYHPLVEEDSWDLEYRTTQRLSSALSPLSSVSRLSVGHALSENLFGEFYVVTERDKADGFRYRSFETEMLWQATEQGQYWLDFGIVWELEKQKDRPEWETAVTLAFEKETGRWSHTLNLTGRFEYEDDEKREWGAKAAWQSRWRFRRSFEPGFEIYAASPRLAIGPFAQGEWRLTQSWLKWQFALLKETREDTDQTIARAAIEWEF